MQHGTPTGQSVRSPAVPTPQPDTAEPFDDPDTASAAMTQAPSPAAGPQRNRGQQRVTVELAAVLALLALGTALRWVNSPTPALLPALQAIGPLVVPPTAALLLVTAATTRRRRTAIAAGVLLAVHVGLLAPSWIPGPQRAVAGAADDPLVVMSSNLRYGTAETRAVADAVRRQDVDVLVVLELTSAAHDRLRVIGIGRQLPYVLGATREDAGGAAVFSRYPVTRSSGGLTPPSLLYETPAATVQTPDGPVVVLAAHPVPPMLRQTRRWHRELTALSAWAAETPSDLPLVLAGDFNATTAHPALRRLGAAGLRNAHLEAGGGPVATWPRFDSGWPAWLHIDHVYVRGLHITGAGTTRIPGSDHDAVWAALVPDTGSTPDAGPRRTGRKTVELLYGIVTGMHDAHVCRLFDCQRS